MRKSCVVMMAMALLFAELDAPYAQGDLVRIATSAEVYEMTAQALGELRCPDFSGIDVRSVNRAFTEAWGSFRAKDEWLRALIIRVAEVSKGRVFLLRGDYYTGIKGPNEPMILVTEGKRLAVVMGPYDPPVECRGPTQAPISMHKDKAEEELRSAD